MRAAADGPAEAPQRMHGGYQMTSGGPLALVGSCEPDGGRAANAADCDLDWQNDYGQTQHAVLLNPLFTTAPRRLSPGSRAFGVLAFSHFLCSTVCPHLSDFMFLSKMRTRRGVVRRVRSPGRRYTNAYYRAAASALHAPLERAGPPPPAGNARPARRAASGGRPHPPPTAHASRQAKRRAIERTPPSSGRPEIL